MKKVTNVFPLFEKLFKKCFSEIALKDSGESVEDSKDKNDPEGLSISPKENEANDGTTDLRNTLINRFAKENESEVVVENEEAEDKKNL